MPRDHRNHFRLLLLAPVVALSPAAPASTARADEVFENSLGMKFVRLAPGRFMMGSEYGDWDERPAHEVTISRPFALAATEVTNAQYEKYDPTHHQFRGRYGVSTDDDAAVVFVTWEEAIAFCQWLAQKEGQPYRLPTEAEWEYACRAGTGTEFNTGDTLPAKDYPDQPERNSAKKFWGAVPASMKTGKTPPNTWGLYDMHGNAEEWCSDWYGPYFHAPQTDPVGGTEGLFKVSRGGSVHTAPFYLRSANRLGSLPQDKHWLIGFRVAMGDAPATKPRPQPPPAKWAEHVSRKPSNWAKRVNPVRPFFAGPIVFQKVPTGADGPLYAKHNHCPAITWCDNGDLLAVWFSCRTEAGREMLILGSRFHAGSPEWTEPDVFFGPPDRNTTGSALLNDGKGTLHFFNGLGAAQGWQVNLALVTRTSTDHGATWSTPILLNPERNNPEVLNQPIASACQLGDGTFVVPCDAPLRSGNIPGGAGTALWMSKDQGRTWRISRGTIAGIHAGVVELADGRLLALGRTLDRKAPDRGLPLSLTRDQGETWEYADSKLPGITGGQRLVLRRLNEGPLLLVSFTDMDLKNPNGMAFRDKNGQEFRGYGLYAAVSFDEGKTWPVRRLVTAGGPARTLDGGAWTREFVMDATHAEPKGYLAATQTPDGLIHLLSSRNHYRFNLPWLRQPVPSDL